VREMSGSVGSNVSSARLAPARAGPAVRGPVSVTLGLETLIMADSQKSMVSIVAIIAIVILVGIVIWFVREESNDGFEIEIGATVTQLVAPTVPNAFPL
jgi:hypothetical protein